MTFRQRHSHTSHVPDDTVPAVDSRTVLPSEPGQTYRPCAQQGSLLLRSAGPASRPDKESMAGSAGVTKINRMSAGGMAARRGKF